MSFGYTTKADNPATLPAGTGQAVAFSPDGAYVAVAHGASSPYLSVYPWNGVQFGAKFADPATLPTGAIDVAWSPDGAWIAVAMGTTPFIAVYPWSGAGFGTKVANPGTLPTGGGQGIGWSPDGAFVAIAHVTAPRISVYPWSSGFGTKVANPGTAIPNTARAVAFSPDGAFIGIAHDNTPFVSVYPWTGTFGTKVANPASLPGTDGRDISWSPDGAYVAVAQVDSGIVSIYPWSGTFGTKVSAPGTPIPGTFGKSVAWAPDSAHVAFGVGGSTPTKIGSVYEWSAGFGTKVTDPAGLQTASGSVIGQGVAFSPGGSVAITWGAISPFFAVFEDGDTVRRAIPAGLITLSGPAPTIAGLTGSITQQIGSFSAQAIRPPAGSDTFPMAGAPSYPLTLFRGAVIGVSADRDDGLLRLVLDCEDYNRQWSLQHVGVPIPGNSLHQPDGTEIDVDPDAMNIGIGPGDGGVVKHFADRYWPPAPNTPDPDLSGVQNTNPDYSTVPMFDRQTAASTLDAILGEFVRQRGSGASRFWVRPVGDDLILTYRVVGLFDGLPDQRVPAPWALSTEGKAGTIMANITADWDAHALRRRVYVRGGTPAACLYVENPGPTDTPTNAGDAFVDAPGALTRAEAIAVGIHHLRNNLREMLISHVHVPPGHFEGASYVRNDGLEPGQSTVLSDTLITGFAGTGPDRIQPLLEDREAIVQTVRWKQITGAPGTGIAIDGVDLSDLVVAWQELSGEMRYGTTPGKATIAVYLWDPPGTDIAVRTLADVKIWLNGTSDVEYDLEVGDVPAGDIALQFNRDQRQPYTKPSHKFTYVVSDPDMPVDGSSDVTIQVTLATYEPSDLAGLEVTTTLLCWADAGQTIPSDEYTLDDDGLPLVLNALGQAYTVLRRVAGTTGFSHYKMFSVAAKKVED